MYLPFFQTRPMRVGISGEMGMPFSSGTRGSMEEKKKSSYAFDSSILQKVDMTSLKTGVK